MSNTIIELRHSYVTGNVPSSLANGEIAINTYDGKLFYRGGASNTIQTIERYEGPSGLDGEIQFNDSGVLGSDSGLTYDKLTNTLDVANLSVSDVITTTGNISGSIIIASGYFEFPDGSKQYTANAGSGGGDGTDQYARDTANAAFLKANNEGGVNTTQNTNISLSYDTANSATSYANSAFVAANTADAKAVIAGSYANSAFEVANSAAVAANTPSHVANSAASYANGAFVAANTAGINAVASGSYANSAFEVANSAAVAANTPSHVANSAASYANSAFDTANNEAGVNATQNNSIIAAFEAANSAGVYANGAFVRANNSLNANTGGIIDGNVIITGNLIVQGTEFITQTDTLAIHDNMIYLNNPIAANVTNAVGNGTHVIYTTEINHGYDPGMGISITGITPSSFNISGASNTLITQVTSNTFTVASSVTDTYVSGGVARARTALNPDLGFAGGYYDTSYAHAGLFRDASDGIWKFFYNYTLEPDTSPYIDTNDPSFRIANLTANIVTDVITVRGIDPLTQANSAFDAANNEAGVNLTQNTNIQLAWNTANAAFEQANTGAGGDAVTISVFNTTANGTTLTYDLGFNPVAANAIFVTIDGIVQPESTYSVNTSANTITFDVEPINGENVRVVAFAQTNPYIIADQSIDPVKFSSATNNFIAIAASESAIALSIALG